MIELSQLNGSSDERGQVGIGTLIVFIAMVLVAAIAAGVLVNTAGFLQATAEDAGQESVDKVTNRIEVVNQHGVVGTDDTVKTLNLTVRLAAGSSAVDLNSSSVKYLSDQEVTTLTNNSDDAYQDHEFNLTKVEGTDSDDSFGVLNSGADRYVIKINTGRIEANSDSEGLGTGDKVQLDITSQTGGTTTVILSMPQQLAGASEDDPIKL